MATTFVLIESATVGSGGASSITLGSGGTIPQTYTDLALFTSLRGSDNIDWAYIIFNGDTSSYSNRRLYGSGSSAGTQVLPNYTYSIMLDASSYTANTFSNNFIYITNYAGSNNKSFSIDSVQENNATNANMDLIAYLWSNSSAITSMTISPRSGTFVQYSTFYLYGIKNS